MCGTKSNSIVCLLRIRSKSNWEPPSIVFDHDIIAEPQASVMTDQDG